MLYSPLDFVGIENQLSTLQNINDSSVKLEWIFNKLPTLFQGGLQLSDIETISFFLIFIRFIVLIFRYNLKTSTYITFIGIFAGYLWYRHLIDVVSWYGQVLVKISFLENLGTISVDLNSNGNSLFDDESIGSEVHWYNPGQLFYYTIIKSTIRTDPATGIKYYMDPISMAISSLDETTKNRLLPYYYTTYNVIIPRIFEGISLFWRQLSGVAAYSLITRIGKRYCPYLVRWHWTFLLVIAFLEQIVVYFVFRVTYFRQFIIQPKVLTAIASQIKDDSMQTPLDGTFGLAWQSDFLYGLMIFFVVAHLGLIISGLFHAICGQYFYFPFLVENTELHIGSRPKSSIYSGGQTAWQDERQPNSKIRFTKIWYGWFGSGKNENWIISSFKQFIFVNIKKFTRLFKR